jgi:formylglycine-generating enzyme required for sulfatase activity
MGMAHHTFISYAYEDGHFVEKLARQLQRRGVPIWFDQWTATSGTDWDRSIERAIRDCGHFILVLSPAATNSWIVRQQFQWARQNGRPILTILHQPCDLPQPLAETPSVDFSGQRYPVALAQLLNYFFPNQSRLAHWLALKAVVKRQLIRRWGQLRPLLWPGWLGPLLLLSLLAAGWLGQRFPQLQPIQSRPTPERLVVIPPVEVAVPEIAKQIRLTDGKVIVHVPAGEFWLGSLADDPLASPDEWPQRRISLAGFWIDRTEITNAEYRRCVEAGGCTPARSQGQRFAEPEQPVVGVDWFQAANYCAWAGGRLPSEAEWEKAARGPDGRTYPWGNEFKGSVLNFCDANCIQDWRDRSANDGFKFTGPVGSYPAGASPYGALDMSGSVWEWVADWYQAEAYALASADNPTGPPAGQQRVIRGGSWFDTGRSLRVANRHKDAPTFRYDKIGFRCVVSDGVPAP